MSENSCGMDSTPENNSIASFGSPKESQNGLKRNVGVSSQADGVSLPKYKRMMTDEEIMESKGLINVPSLPDMDKTSESSLMEENVYHDKENIPDNSSVSYDDRCTDNDQNDDFQYDKEVDANHSGFISSPKAKFSIVQRSQMTVSNISSNGSLTVTTIKQSNSQSYESENEPSDEQLMEAESLNLSRTRGDEQENDQDMPNMISASQYAGTSQSPDGRPNPMAPQILPALIHPAQAYVQQNNLMRPIVSNMQLNPMPSTSANVPAVNIASNLENPDVPNLILGLRNDIKALTHKLEDQENILSAVVAANQIYLEPLLADSFPQRYNLRLPLSRLEDFQNFNQTLINNTRFANEFIMDLCTCIDNNTTLAKNVLKMLRKYMSKELARLFTACQKTPNKMVLKDTMFCTCLLQALKISIRNGMLPLELEKSFFRNLSHVVTGAKGWQIHDDISDE